MRTLTDKQLESSIARMLRFGVMLSAAVVLAGGALYLRNTSMSTPDYSHFRAAQTSLRTITGVLHGVSHMDAQSVIQLGILLLIATPVARVILCIVGFARQRDRLYIAVSITVFIILIYCLFCGGR